MNYLKHKFYNLLTTMIVLFIFVLSGASFFNISRVWFIWIK
ncbi:hypothetical protein W893_10990 [Staphylococcus aureus subsp. aureus ST 1413]|nr:hypothetical protein W893_10990 [Staphylococcus aureus subsp. aureus ST 1413]